MNIIYHNQAFELQKHGQPPTCQVQTLILLNVNTVWPWCCIQLVLLWLVQPTFSLKLFPSAPHGASPASLPLGLHLLAALPSSDSLEVLLPCA